MKQKNQVSKSSCLNCGETVTDAFCQRCGQRVRDNLDRSLGRLLGEFFGNIFFLDNRFLISIWFLVRYPGRMTTEFLEGKRKKFISPVTLFLFINLIYFLVNPLSDYSLALYDQAYSQPYSSWTINWLEDKLQERGMSFQEYSSIYQNASDNISKSIMIINAPMIALVLYLITFRKRKYYFDSLIYSFHFFTLFMLSWVMLDWIGNLFYLLMEDVPEMMENITFLLFTFLLPILYAILSIRRFMNLRWYWSIPAGFAVLLSVLIAQFAYRFIIFVTTLLAT
ncbi:MAG: DUF3667 domain-containing protein [Bacteroidota bacterium]